MRLSARPDRLACARARGFFLPRMDWWRPFARAVRIAETKLATLLEERCARGHRCRRIDGLAGKPAADSTENPAVEIVVETSSFFTR
jgi:hypothetical protein